MSVLIDDGGVAPTARNLFGGTTPAIGFSVHNPAPSGELWVRDTGQAAPWGAGSIRVAPGATYTTPAGYVPQGAVSVVGNSGAVTAKAW